MKKFIGPLWAKAIALILCIVSLSGCILAAIGIVVKEEITSTETAMKKVYESIAQNYSAEMLSSYLQGEPGAFFDMEKNSNLRFTVLKGRTNPWAVSDSVVVENWIEHAQILHGEDKDLDKYSYLFYGALPDEGTYIYNTNSLQEAVMTHASYEGEYGKVQEKISYFLYAKDMDLIYAKTPSGLFTVSNLSLLVGSSLEVVQFTREPEGKMYYADGTRQSLGIYLDDAWNYITLRDSEGTDSGYVIYPYMEAPYSEVGIRDFNALYVVDELAEVNEEVYDTYFTFCGKGWIEHSKLFYYPYYCVLSYVDPGMPEDDLFAEADRKLLPLLQLAELSPILLIPFSALFLVSLVYLVAAAGHRRGSNTIMVRCWDRIPYEIYLLFEIGAFVFAFSLLAEGPLRIAYKEKSYLLFAVQIVVVLEFLLLAFVLSTAVRIKAKVFGRYTLLHYIATPIRWCFGRIKCFGGYIQKTYQDKMPLLGKTIAAVTVVAIAELGIISVAIECGRSGNLFFAFGICIMFKAAEVALVLLVIAQMKRLQDGGYRVARGDWSVPIDTGGMFWEFKKHADNINQLGDGISLAVEKQMKSERFRTELITNVSHDIKTPLTSIINYVDLIKKEGFKEPPMAEYVEVLDRQSARLKKLVEDLLEASKASTGNLPVVLERCDTTVMLTQVVGEFEERLRDNGLQLIVKAPEEPVYITADSRHLWRVFDNLMNNIRKYAQPGTRVYINLESGEKMATIIFRNISRYQLNVSSEELMERFVRGDASRNTEGSGLGLNITQSLMALMHGTMRLDTDGDLFKVTLQLPLQWAALKRPETDRA